VNQTTEAGIAVVCMLAMFGVGMWTSTDNITYKTESGFGYQYVNFTGTIYEGEYRFKMVEEIPNNKSGVTTNGRTYPRSNSNLVKIRADRPAEEVIDTCRHEVLHHYFPRYRHPDFSQPGVEREDDPIYRLEDNVDFGLCDKVVSKALMRQR
jgi:hypothetical protein